MKKLLLLSNILFCFSILISWNKKKNVSAFDELRPYILSELKKSREDLYRSIKPDTDRSKQKEAYLSSREHYKHIEFFVEYCSPDESKYMINGPLVPKNDHEMGSLVIYPLGFQVIEELLFSEGQNLDTVELNRQYRQLIYKFDALQNYYEEISIADELLLEMCQYQLYRISSLSLNGYDATILKNNIQEVVWSFEGIDKAISTFKPYLKKHQGSSEMYEKLKSQLITSKMFLYSNFDYDSFDRLSFIVNYINPINELLVVLHNQLALPWNIRNQALLLNNKNLFSAETFNSRYFSSDYMDTINLNVQAQLGKLLFFDPALSGNGERSCASCHNPSFAYTDGLTTSKSFKGEIPLFRNAPTLIDIAFQKAYFWDGRAIELEQQIFDVVHNENEMSGNLEEIAIKLRNSQEYKELFNNSYKGTGDTIITGYAIQKALSEFEKTLISFNSKFDKYINGNLSSLNQREINGYNLFAGKALCGSCHFFPVFNGTVPPLFNDSEFEVLGVASSFKNIAMDEDPGRYRVTNLELHKFSFKTPGLRNIELTAPYMHNGAYKNLEQVLDFYHKGGGKGIGFFLGDQTLPFDSLSLSEKEKEDIIFFMKSLTDTSGLTSVPKVLPAFNDLPRRPVGGKY